jgi:molecular chaperone GrpE (heat shock protein)
MRDPMSPRIPKWPFFVGDAFLLGAAWFVYFQSQYTMGLWQIAFVVLCVAGGAVAAILPFLLEYRLALKLIELKTLTDALGQIRNVEKFSEQVAGATGRWEEIQQQAERTSKLAGDIAEKMGAEVKAFTEFMQQMNNSEKATLRLEVEKLRRAEGDWVQVLVRMLDHTYALHQGALRSGQPNVIRQITSFQNACRDVARRVGVTPFVPAGAEPFDPKRHQLLDAQARPEEGATVAETIATGYTFQGKLLRPALVRLRSNGAPEPASGTTP